MTLKKALPVFAISALLAACQSSPPPRDLPPVYSQTRPAGSPVDGSWTDPNGLISSFNAGRFDTRTTDGNNGFALHFETPIGELMESGGDLFLNLY